ncbi:hypothetical protein [Joostella sp. CR20]|uniref:hypothetical protein n=1 Tax=Joostella sp. CR20 TaxID=2804312 RepID=UPI00313D1CE8
MKFDVLLNKIAQSPRLDFGDIFGKSIDLFKKTWTQGLLLLLTSLVLVIPLVILLYSPMFVSAFTGDFDPETGKDLPVGAIIAFAVIFIPVLILIQTVGLALMSGYYKIIQEIDLKGAVQNASLFMFFKSQYLGKLFTISFFSIVITLLAMLLCVIPMFYVAIPLYFVAVVFAFNPELSAKENIQVCFKLGHKKWWLTFGLVMVAGLLAEMVGLLLCGIGLLFTASFPYLPIYLIYKDAVGFDENETQTHAISEF